MDERKNGEYTIIQSLMIGNAEFVMGYNGLFKDSMVLLEQIRTIDKSRIIHYIGRISKKHINGINKALGISVGLYDAVPIFLCGKCAKTLHSSGTFFLKKANNGTSIEHCVLCKKEKAKVYEISLHV